MPAARPLAEIAQTIFVGRTLSRIKTDPSAPICPVINARDVSVVLAPAQEMDKLHVAAGGENDSVRICVGDIVVTTRGSVRAALALSEHEGAIVGPNLAIVRLEDPTLRPVLTAYLRHPIVQEELQAKSRGSATTGLGVADLKSLPIVLPHLKYLKDLSEAVALTDRYVSAAMRSVEIRQKILIEHVRRALSSEGSS